MQARLLEQVGQAVRERRVGAALPALGAAQQRPGCLQLALAASGRLGGAAAEIYRYQDACFKRN